MHISWLKYNNNVQILDQWSLLTQEEEENGKCSVSDSDKRIFGFDW